MKKIAYIIFTTMVVILLSGCEKVDLEQEAVDIAKKIEADTLSYIHPLFDFEKGNISFDTLNFSVSYTRDSIKVTRVEFNEKGNYDTANVTVYGYYSGYFKMNDYTRKFTSEGTQLVKMIKSNDWEIKEFSGVERLSDTMVINILKVVIEEDTIVNPNKLYPMDSILQLKTSLNIDVEIDMDSVYGFPLIFTEQGIFNGTYHKDKDNNHWWKFTVTLDKTNKTKFLIIKAYHTRMFTEDYPFDVNEWLLPYKTE